MGLIELEDAETGETMVVDSASLRVRQGYEKIGRSTRDERADLFRRLDVDQVEIETDQGYVDAILRYFRQREKKLR